MQFVCFCGFLRARSGPAGVLPFVKNDKKGAGAAASRPDHYSILSFQLSFCSASNISTICPESSRITAAAFSDVSLSMLSSSPVSAAICIRVEIASICLAFSKILVSFFMVLFPFVVVVVCGL